VLNIKQKIEFFPSISKNKLRAIKKSYSLKSEGQQEQDPQKESVEWRIAIHSKINITLLSQDLLSQWEI
jgi:hypothetical protein